MSSKLVDSEYIARLVANSFEVRWGAVSTAMEENHDLFGGPKTQVIATFDHHLIAADPDGKFYRAKWDLTEDGDVLFSEIEDIDVPVFEAADVAPHARQQAITAVEAIISGDAESARGALSELYQMVREGASLTSEGVLEEYERQTSADRDWFQAISENETKVRAFLGVDATQLPVHQPAFASLASDDLSEDDADRYRSELRTRLGQLNTKMNGLRDRLILAREVTEDYSLKRGGDDSAMSVVEFVEFTQELAIDLDDALGLIEDAMAVADDGSVKSLAQVHDGIAGEFTEWALAAAFAEKLARRFEAPSQAA